MTGADTEEDPSFCSQLAVGASSSPDFSPCREDGTCGLCNTCEFWDGSVIAVESEEECPGAGTGTPWQTKEEYRSVSHTSYPDMGCGRTMSVHFSDLEPSPGDLVLRLLVAGDMEPGTRFFTLSINDETEEIVVMDGEETGFVWETHDPDDCFETQGSAPEPYCTCPLNKDASVELLLADRWKNEEKLKIAVVGNESGASVRNPAQGSSSIGSLPTRRPFRTIGSARDGMPYRSR